MGMDLSMKYSPLFLAFGLLAMLANPSIVSAQPSGANDTTAPVTGMKPDRTTAPLGIREAMKKEAEKRKQRAECRARAKSEKVPLVKRPAYVKNCMAQS